MLTFEGESTTTSSISGTTDVAAKEHVHSVTTTIDFTKAGFSGTAATLSHEPLVGTPARFIATFTGATHNSTAKYTPAGTVSQPTFKGDRKLTEAANS